MRINIQTPTNGIVPISVESNRSIEVVKQDIEATTGIPSYQQRLTFAGKQLEDAHIIADYNIQHESTLQLVLNLKGG